MEDSRDQTPEVARSAVLGRRKFLVKAAIAGTAAWAVPTIVTMEPAGAAGLTSPPPVPPDVEVKGETTINPPVAAEPATETAAKPAVEVRGALAFTGAPIATFVGVGAAAIAGGGALHQWSAHAARRVASEPGGAMAPVRPAIIRRVTPPEG